MKKTLAAAVLVIATACGGDGSSGGPVSIDDFPATITDANCGYLFRCCTDAEIMTEFMGVTVGNGSAGITTELQCEQYESGLIDAFSLPYLKQSIAAGRASYDGSVVASCASALDALACGGMSSLEQDPACKGYIVPLVADDGACTQNYECTSGNCEGATDGSDGMCAPIPELGSACDLVCDAGLYCGVDHSLNNVCMAQGGVGSACTNDGQCTSDSCVGTGSDGQTDRMCTDASLTCVGR
jgi:hypothetical protein